MSWVQQTGQYSAMNSGRQQGLASWGLSNNALQELKAATAPLATAATGAVTTPTQPSLLSYYDGSGQAGQTTTDPHPDQSVRGALSTIGPMGLAAMTGPVGVMGYGIGRAAAAAYDAITGLPIGTHSGFYGIGGHAFGGKPDSLGDRIGGALGLGMGGPSANADKAADLESKGLSAYDGGPKDAGFAGHSNMNESAPAPGEGKGTGGPKGADVGEQGTADFGGVYAKGGLVLGDRDLASMPMGAFVQAPSGGMADAIEAVVDGKEPAKISAGEFIMPADFVSMLGDGNSAAGAAKLEAAIAKLRKLKTGKERQLPQFNGTLLDLL